MQDIIITRDIGFEALTLSYAMRLVFSSVPGDNFNPVRGGEKPFTSYPELPDCPYYSAYRQLQDYLESADDDAIPDGYVPWYPFEELTLSVLLDRVFEEAVAISHNLSDERLSCLPLTRDELHSLSGDRWELVKVEGQHLIAADDVREAWSTLIDEALSGNALASKLLCFIGKNKSPHALYVRDVDVEYYESDSDFNGADDEEADDDAYQCGFVVRFSDNSTILFPTEKAACGYQRLYRILVGLDPDSGE